VSNITTILVPVQQNNRVQCPGMKIQYLDMESAISNFEDAISGSEKWCNSKGNMYTTQSCQFSIKWGMHAKHSARDVLKFIDLKEQTECFLLHWETKQTAVVTSSSDQKVMELKRPTVKFLEFLTWELYYALLGGDMRDVICFKIVGKKLLVKEILHIKWYPRRITSTKMGDWKSLVAWPLWWRDREGEAILTNLWALLTCIFSSAWL